MCEKNPSFVRTCGGSGRKLELSCFWENAAVKIFVFDTF